MNLNIVGYVIYMCITAYIIIIVGRICYRNGNIFVSELLPDHTALCHKINQILRIGYYLLNIGYCAMTLISWEKLTSAHQVIETVSFRAAIIIGVICALHYFNIFMLTKYIKKLIN